MKLAVCDNEISQISQVTELLSAYRAQKGIDLRWSAFQSGFALLSALDSGEDFDAVLLDIYMEGMNGMEAARQIRAVNSSMHIVFLTSSPLFAVESYTVEAADYLLKPIAQQRLFLTLDRLVSRISTNGAHGFTVKDTDGRITRILLDQLMYLEAMGHYAVLHHANGTTTRTLTAFSVLMEQLLPHADFIQSHRSYVVNLRYVHRIGKHELVMLNGTQIPLPKSRHQQLTDRFHDYIFGGERL